MSDAGARASNLVTMNDGATPRTLVRTFWRRTLFGPSIGARIRIYEELAPSLAAGIGLKEALHSAADRSAGSRGRALRLLADGLDRDVPLAVTMRANPDVFTPIEAALVATGDRTGRMDVAFRAASTQLERALAVRDRVRHAVAYPLLLVHCFILMASFVRMCFGHSFLLMAVPSFVVLWSAILFGVSLHVAKAGDAGYARLVRRLPLFGPVVRIGSLSRFTRVFGALYGAGVTYAEALPLAGEASGDAAVASEVGLAADALTRGATFAEAISLVASIPTDEMGLFLAGEKAGDLENAALRVSVLEEARFDVAVNRMSAMLRNGLVLLMGLAVGLYAMWFYGKIYGDALKGL